MNRNPFFYTTGFKEQERTNITEGESSNRHRLDRIKERRRAEKRLHKKVKRETNGRRTTRSSSTRGEQIRRGFLLAKKWMKSHG